MTIFEKLPSVRRRVALRPSEAEEKPRGAEPDLVKLADVEAEAIEWL